MEVARGHSELGAKQLSPCRWAGHRPCQGMTELGERRVPRDPGHTHNPVRTSVSQPGVRGSAQPAWGQTAHPDKPVCLAPGRPASVPSHTRHSPTPVLLSWKSCQAQFSDCLCSTHSPWPCASPPHAMLTPGHTGAPPRALGTSGGHGGHWPCSGLYLALYCLIFVTKAQVFSPRHYSYTVCLPSPRDMWSSELVETWG